MFGIIMDSNDLFQYFYTRQLYVSLEIADYIWWIKKYYEAYYVYEAVFKYPNVFPLLSDTGYSLRVGESSWPMCLKVSVDQITSCQV